MFDFSNDVALQSGICSENKILFLGEFIFDKFLPKISYCYLNQVSRIFIGRTSWFQQIKLQIMLLLFEVALH